MTRHVRIVERRPSRRIGGTAGSSRTLCGCPESQFTAYDAPYRDAARASLADRQRWIDCQACLDALPPAKSTRTRIATNTLDREDQCSECGVALRGRKFAFATDTGTYCSHRCADEHARQTH